MSFAPSSVNARLHAAQGYLGLGMAQEVWDELEQFDDKDRGKPDFLDVARPDYAGTATICQVLAQSRCYGR